MRMNIQYRIGVKDKQLRDGTEITIDQRMESNYVFLSESVDYNDRAELIEASYELDHSKGKVRLARIL